MSETTLWNQTRSLLVTYNFKDETDIKGFRSALDKQLNQSTVERIIIIVSVPRHVDKTKLSPHFLIYYNSPSDYTLFGKLRDLQLKNELKRSFDLMLSFGSLNRKIKKYLDKMKIAKKIIINAELAKDSSYEMELNSASESPAEIVNFVIETLQKIDVK
tara:strand:+ start:2210 stop:2686 length:477 start_codon:yes stop_codon:yes gene_type:complete